MQTYFFQKHRNKSDFPDNHYFHLSNRYSFQADY